MGSVEKIEAGGGGGGVMHEVKISSRHPSNLIHTINVNHFRKRPYTFHENKLVPGNLTCWLFLIKMCRSWNGMKQFVYLLGVWRSLMLFWGQGFEVIFKITPIIGFGNPSHDLHQHPDHLDHHHWRLQHYRGHHWWANFLRTLLFRCFAYFEMNTQYIRNVGF